MWKAKRISRLVLGFVMAIAVSGTVVSQGMAQDLTEPSRVMDSYLASLVGGLLITRGLSILIPSMQDSINALIALALTAGGIVYQGGFLSKSQTDTPDSSSSS